jgi:hypothetical protein
MGQKGVWGRTEYGAEGSRGAGGILARLGRPGGGRECGAAAEGPGSFKLGRKGASLDLGPLSNHDNLNY